MKTAIPTLGISMLLVTCLLPGSVSATTAKKPKRAARSAAAQKVTVAVPADTAAAASPTVKSVTQPSKPVTTGTLKAPYDDFSIALLSFDGERMQQIDGKNGLATAPKGNYWITSWQIHTRDKQGRIWRAQGGPFGQPQTGLHVSPGSTSEIRLANPIRLDLQIDQADGAFTFLMLFIGTTGDRCTRVFVNDADPPAPKMKITDADGKLLTTLEFHYGCGFVCRNMWKAPADAKWPLKATTEIDFGPFPVITGDPVELHPIK